MGVFNNKFSRSRTRQSPILGPRLWAALLLGLAFAWPAQADPRESNVYVIKQAKRRPVAAVGQNRTSLQPATVETTSNRALTRAAAKNKVESISPMNWLKRYGDVQVSQSDQ